MQRSKQHRKGRRRRQGGGGKTFIILALVVILGISLWSSFCRVSAEIEAAAEKFMECVVASDTAAASAFIFDEEEQVSKLDLLIVLFQGDDFTYSSTGCSRPTGLFSGTSLIHFYSDGSLYTVPLQLVRREGSWMIKALPDARNMDGALVEKFESGSLHLLWQGERIKIPVPDRSTIEPGKVARVQTLGSAVIIRPLEERSLSRLLRYSDCECEGELEGNLVMEKPLSVYLIESRTAQARSGSLADLVVGMTDLLLYLAEGKVVAVKIEQDFLPQTVRVLLRQNLSQLSSESLFHERLCLNSTRGYNLEDKQGGALFTFEPGQTLVVEPAGDSIKVTPEGLESIIFTTRIFLSAHQNGMIMIENLTRDGWPGGIPAYRGTLEISNQEGRLIAVNEPDLEKYLYTVVPSEMSDQFGLEPLKTQAVAARSYAYRSIFSSGYSCYGAHLDDSVVSQVYNNIPEQPGAVEAVESTAGMVLFYGDQAADTRFFSTSCGFTANYHEVWSDPETGSFPAEPVPYLKAVSQVPGESFELEREEELARFLQHGDWPAYDRDSPYFRWQVKMSEEQLTAVINHNLSQRYQEQPDFILTQEGGQFCSIEIPRNPVGRLREIRVLQRGEGGNIMILEVEGTNGTYRIMKEYNIRHVLRPANYLPASSPVILYCHDGSRALNYPILPSAFAYFDVERNASGEITQVVIFGGGNGHGVGMSQYGARGLAEQGHDFKEILNHYYPGAELRCIYAP